MSEEEWRPVVGYEGFYEVSSLGRVRNIATGMGRTPGRILKPHGRGRYGHQAVDLRDGKRTRAMALHRVVALAFIPNPRNLPLVLHADDDVTNNRVSNLRWGTHKDNTRDMMNKGRNRNQFSGVDTCARGHKYTGFRRSSGVRQCLVCTRTPPPPGDPRHGIASTYGNMYCRCDMCREAWRIKSAKQRTVRRQRGD